MAQDLIERLNGEVLSKRGSWDRASREWSQDVCQDMNKTVQIGENMMFAAIGIICAQETLIEALRAQREGEGRA